MSIIFGAAFALASVVSWMIRGELAIMPSERRVRVRTGSRRIFFERSVSFAQIRFVRCWSAMLLTSGPIPDERVCQTHIHECA